MNLVDSVSYPCRQYIVLSAQIFYTESCRTLLNTSLMFLLQISNPENETLYNCATGNCYSRWDLSVSPTGVMCWATVLAKYAQNMSGRNCVNGNSLACLFGTSESWAQISAYIPTFPGASGSAKTLPNSS